MEGWSIETLQTFLMVIVAFIILFLALAYLGKCDRKAREEKDKRQKMLEEARTDISKFVEHMFIDFLANNEKLLGRMSVGETGLISLFEKPAHLQGLGIRSIGKTAEGGYVFLDLNLNKLLTFPPVLKGNSDEKLYGSKT